MRAARALAFAALLLAAACSGGAPARTPVLDARRTDLLRGQLASSGRYYFELRLSEAAVILCHSGVEITRYPASELRVGVPRIAGIPRGGAEPWAGEIWSPAALDPPLVVERVRIIPGNEATRPTPDAAGVVPPTLSDLTPVPPSFQIVFPDSRCIQVDLRGEISGKVHARSRLASWWDDFLQGLDVRQPHRVRFRMTMDAKDGAGLYRSFPDSPAFLVVP